MATKDRGEIDSPTGFSQLKVTQMDFFFFAAAHEARPVDAGVVN